MRKITTLLLGSTLLALAACNGDPAPTVDAPAPPAAAPAPAGEAAVIAAEAMAVPTPSAPMPLNAAAVDTCALLSAEDAALVLGALSGPPTAKPAQGSLLGQCDYSGTKGLVMVSARPAREYEDSLKFAAKRGPTRELSGTPAPAMMTAAGVMLAPPGRHYFVMLNAISFSGGSSVLSEGIAKRLNFGAAP